jgi:hypothetical protein
MKGVNTQSSTSITTHSYITELLDSRLSCAQRADVYTFFEDPWNVEQRANALNSVAREKRKEVYRSVRANERCFDRRMAKPDCGYLEIEETRPGENGKLITFNLWSLVKWGIPQG